MKFEKLCLKICGYLYQLGQHISNITYFYLHVIGDNMNRHDHNMMDYKEYKVILFTIIGIHKWV